MKTLLKQILLAVSLSVGMIVWGCSSSPSDEEMKTLRDLQDQVTSLQAKVSGLEKDKAGLEKQIAEKNGKLQQCQSDQDAVKKGLGK